MSKFNKKPSIERWANDHPDRTSNYEGGMAYTMDIKAELVTRTLSTFLSDKFYEKENDAMQGLLTSIKNVLEVDPEFVLKLAVYARKEMHLRSVPLLLLNEFAKSEQIVCGGRKYVSACIERVDDITELLALSISSREHHPEKRFRKKTSMFIKNGLAPAFNYFDEYQFAKYDRLGEVKLRDALFMCHPEPANEEQARIFDAIANESLATPMTWEVEISKNGSNKESWEAVIPRMGYMATLRNLENFIENDVNMGLVLERLTNPTAIHNSKLYPFRYYAAYKSIGTAAFKSYDTGRKFTDALKIAMETSISNLPKIPGRSLILIDTSGSMTRTTISKRSTITAAEIAGMFGAIASNICEHSDVIVFADTFGRMKFDSTSILEKMKEISSVDVGCATYANLPIKYINDIKLKYDRIFLFSDMQCYNENPFQCTGFGTEFTQYQRNISPAYLYSVDLAGYGTALVPKENDKVLTLAGFSERILNFVPLFESDRNSLIGAIEDYDV